MNKLIYISSLLVSLFLQNYSFTQVVYMTDKLELCTWDDKTSDFSNCILDKSSRVDFIFSNNYSLLTCSNTSVTYYITSFKIRDNDVINMEYINSNGYKGLISIFRKTMMIQFSVFTENSIILLKYRIFNYYNR